ncbi:MAG: DUF2807 domain-containing protein [Bacteroidales bacterium]|nr:DUF2807 domain-containing protein [Bacteroidales bacterium]
MRALKFIVIVFIALVLAASCSKTSVDCFSDPGNVVSEIRALHDTVVFNSIEMYDNIDVELVASNVNQIKVITGENLMAGISTEMKDDTTLVIKNNNTCDIMRPGDRYFKVIVFYKQLNSITYRSNGNLSSLGKITSNKFKIDIFEGSGKIDLELNTLESRLNYHFGTADLVVRGSSNVNYIYQVSYGPLHASNLNTTFTYLETRSPNDCYVHADLELSAKINGPGDVFYSGNVENPALSGSGSGRLIRLD